jgi:hypothetical protein
LGLLTIILYCSWWNYHPLQAQFLAMQGLAKWSK